ncbi:MAG TPA: Holliday junction resolvase RuvX [Candidatus Fimihabitans intestinipullorum]|uniref:Putative pre-16S rRNA nuclease n=1 Tax=Candidatus Fimihabitans intestinipullorum TaxID=2840820 RepID=A0A9D1HTC1_9BACT|nr:Holliday junction resolvase RuvX [Candidatus Fimihabitans intestinipullorum]
MRYLGLDLGTRTLGLALSDVTGTIASPLKTIRFEEGNYDSLLPQLKDLVTEYQVEKLVLGLPKNMNNSIGERAETTLAFQKKLEEYLGKKVVMQDERLSTVEATNYMLAADISRKKRKKKVDSLAANIILQTYLDKEKGMNL